MKIEEFILDEPGDWRHFFHKNKSCSIECKVGKKGLYLLLTYNGKTYKKNEIQTINFLNDFYEGELCFTQPN